MVNRTYASAVLSGFALIALTLAEGRPVWAQAAEETRSTPIAHAKDDCAAGCTPSSGPQFPASVHTRAQEAEYRRANARVHNFYLKNAPSANDGNEMLTGLRLLLDPSIKLYLIPSQNIISADVLPLEVTMIEQWLAAWDRPRPTYRMVYTVTESDAGKTLGVQHFSLDAVAGQRATLKNGSRVPVVTGAFSTGEKTAAGASGAAMGVQTQYQYVDIGLNIDATLSETGNGAQLRSKIEQSSLVEAGAGPHLDDPVIRQTVLEGVFLLVSGKPLTLGEVDITGSTRHVKIDVLLEPQR